MLDTETSAVLAVARACVWANRVDLLEGALHETCWHGQAAGLEYLRAYREGERTTGARQMRPAAPAAGPSASERRSVTHAELERAAQTRFKAQNGRGD